MYAVGVCWRRGEWIFSLYHGIGDEYATLKIRKVGRAGVEADRCAVKDPFKEVVGHVGRLAQH